MQDSLNELKRANSWEQISKRGVTWDEFNVIIGVSSWRRRELEFLPEDRLREMYGKTELSETIDEEKSRTSL
ncbi:hypothetical protein GF319_05555|nr:hypothetical protein [Candidatus Bathyarchaeota archaeon]